MRPIFALPASSEIPVRFVKHDFGLANSIRFVEIALLHRRLFNQCFNK